MAYDDYTDPLSGFPMNSTPLPGIVQGAVPGITGVNLGAWSDNAYGSDNPMGGAWTPPSPAAAVDDPRAETSAFNIPKNPPKKEKRPLADLPYWLTGTQKPGTDADFPDINPSASGEPVSAKDQSRAVPDSVVAKSWPPANTGPIQYGNAGMAYAPGQPAARSDAGAPGAATGAPSETAAPPPNKTVPPGSVASIAGGETPSPKTGVAGLLGDRFGDMFSGFNNWRNDNRQLLLALAGGIGSNQSLGKGIGEGFSAAARMMPEQNALNNQNATQQFFMSPQGGNMSPALARAFSANPQLTQEAIGQITGYAPPKTIQVKDWMGNEHSYQYNYQTKEWSPLNIAGGTQGVNGTGSMSIGSTLGGPGDPRWEAADPETRIQSLTDPNMKALATSMRHGGNISGRQQLTSTNALMAMIDPNWNQVTSYDAAKTMAQDLQKSSPSSAGGLLANGFSAFGHLGELGDAMVGVGAYNGPSIPGGAAIGQLGNYVRTAAASPDLKAAQSQEADTALKYGEEGTKFYAATGGGEAERTAALNNATGGGKLSAEKAGYLRAELGLMQRRMQDQLDKVQASPGAFDWMQKNRGRIQQMGQDIARTKHAIAQLDPNGPEAMAERNRAAAPPAAAPAAQQDPISQARMAIAQGAPRDAVIQRLRQLGINPPPGL